MNIARIAILPIMALALSGCSYGEVFARHESHPLNGKPFEAGLDCQFTVR